MSSDENNNEYGKKNSKDRDLDDFFSDDDFEFEGQEEDEEMDESGYRSRRSKDRRRKKRLIVSALSIVLILAVIAVGIVFGYRFIKNRFFSGEEVAEEESITIPENLVLDQDITLILAGARDNLLEPEMNSIILSSFNSTETRLTSLCLPVKTLMEIPGFGLESIDKSVEYGGMDLLSLTLEKGLGVEASHYLLMDIGSVVDTLGGVEVSLDNAVTITLDDGSEQTLDAGSSNMDGLTAINYLEKFSGSEGAVTAEDVKKQKAVYNAIIDKINAETGEELAKNISNISGYIDTDMNLEDLSKAVATFSKIEAVNDEVYGLDISSVEIEGQTFYVPDISRIADIFSTEQVAEEEIEEANKTVSIVVLNGEGTPGLAGKTADLIAGMAYGDGKSKFNVLEEGNADSFDYETTEIIISANEPHIMAAAEDLMGYLGAGNIITEEGASQAEVTLILGKDFNINAVGEAGLPEEETAEGEAEDTEELIKVNILNGEGTAGLAATVENILEEEFNSETKVLEVVETKNADNWDYTQSTITVFTNKEGVTELAQDIQEQLGVGVIESSDNNVDNVDISILLGSDYTNQ